MNNNSEEDEEEARTSLSLARPVVAVTSSKYTRPSTIESPFSPTRKHVYPESPQRSPKVKDFRVEVANVLLDWPRTNDKETPPQQQQQQQHQHQQQHHQHQHQQQQQQWRAMEAAAPACPANTHSNTYTHAAAAGDTTRNARSLDLKRPGANATTTHHHQHQHHNYHRRNHSTVTPAKQHNNNSNSNTALGAMPTGPRPHAMRHRHRSRFSKAAGRFSTTTTTTTTNNNNNNNNNHCNHQYQLDLPVALCTLPAKNFDHSFKTALLYKEIAAMSVRLDFNAPTCKGPPLACTESIKSCFVLLRFLKKEAKLNGLMKAMCTIFHETFELLYIKDISLLGCGFSIAEIFFDGPHKANMCQKLTAKEILLADFNLLDTPLHQIDANEETIKEC
ncbi:hypothetical protein HDU77_008424, partial [Chytriomyces hyalinus]